jgi:hypothetical protein
LEKEECGVAARYQFLSAIIIIIIIIIIIMFIRRFGQCWRYIELTLLHTRVRALWLQSTEIEIVAEPVIATNMWLRLRKP